MGMFFGKLKQEGSFHTHKHKWQAYIKHTFEHTHMSFLSHSMRNIKKQAQNTKVSPARKRADEKRKDREVCYSCLTPCNLIEYSWFSVSYLCWSNEMIALCVFVSFCSSFLLYPELESKKALLSENAISRLYLLIYFQLFVPCVFYTSQFLEPMVYLPFSPCQPPCAHRQNTHSISRCKCHGVNSPHAYRVLTTDNLHYLFMVTAVCSESLCLCVCGGLA